MIVPLRTNCPGQTGHIDDASAERGADGASIGQGLCQLDAGLGRLDLSLAATGLLAAPACFSLSSAEAIRSRAFASAGSNWTRSWDSRTMTPSRASTLRISPSKGATSFTRRTGSRTAVTWYGSGSISRIVTVSIRAEAGWPCTWGTQARQKAKAIEDSRNRMANLPGDRSESMGPAGRGPDLLQSTYPCPRRASTGGNQCRGFRFRFSVFRQNDMPPGIISSRRHDRSLVSDARPGVRAAGSWSGPLAGCRSCGYDRAIEPSARRPATLRTSPQNERVLAMLTDRITRRGFVGAVGVTAGASTLLGCAGDHLGGTGQREGPPDLDRGGKPGEPVARLVPAAARGRDRGHRRR